MAEPLQIGRYVLHGEIASGGMASVHYGRLVGAAGFAKTVAIKRLHRALAHNDSFRTMIVEEGRLAARVRHPNVVPPLDVLAEGGELLLVMEYVHGEALSRLMRAAWNAGETIPLAVGAAIMSNVLQGLHAAHEAKDEAGKPLDIVHRDISPQNVIVGVDGAARVIDFGIAKAVTSEGNTTAGTIKGKVPYLSPEQLEGDPATRRTDIYAASVVFWEVLAGKRLFDGADDAEVLRQIIAMDVPPPSTHNPNVPRAIDDVVLRGIARKPADRFPTAREMALAIEGAVHLATQTQVGAWAERLAVDTLAERAKHIAEVENAPSAPGEDKEKKKDVGEETLDEIRTAPRAAQVKTQGTQRLPPPAPPAKRPSTAPPPPAPAPPLPPPPPAATPPPPPAPTVKAGGKRPPARAAPEPSQTVASGPHEVKPSAAPRMEPRTIIYEPPPMPEPEFVAGVRALSASTPPPAPTPPPPRASMPSVPPVLVPSAAGAAARASDVEWIKDQAPPKVATRRSRVKVFFGYLGGFVLFALIVAWFFAPALVRAWIVTSAADRGIVVTIERVDVSRKQVHLVDVKAESKEIPGVALRAGTLDINLRFLAPDKVMIDDAELTLEGSFSEIGSRLEKYRAVHAAQIAQSIGNLREIEVTSGRVDWRGIVGVGTSAMVENVTMTITRKGNRALGDDYRISAPLFNMKLGTAPAGPWLVEVDRQGVVQRTVVKFDPSGMYPGTFTRTASDDGGFALTFAIPPTRLVDLRFPAAVLGGFATGQTRFDARGDMKVVRDDKGRNVTSRLAFGVANVAVFPSGPPVDLTLDFPPSGNANAPIPLSATLAIAPDDPNGAATGVVASVALAGTLDLTGPSAKLELAGKSTPIPCAKDPAAKPLPKGATAPTTGMSANVVMAFDELSTSKVSFAPTGACVPKLK